MFHDFHDKHVSKARNTQVGDKPHTRTHRGVGTRETASPMYNSARLWCAPSSLTLWGNTRPADKGSGELPKKLGSHPDAHATEGHVTPAILARGPQTGDDRKPGSESEPGDGYRTHQAPAKAIGRLAKKNGVHPVWRSDTYHIHILPPAQRLRKEGFGGRRHKEYAPTGLEQCPEQRPVVTHGAPMAFLLQPTLSQHANRG